MSGNVVRFPVEDAAAEDLVLLPVKDATGAPITYELVYVGHATCHVFGSPKLRLEFRVVTYGTAFGKVLPRWYRCRVPRHEKYRVNGRFSVGPHAAFARDWRLIFGHNIGRWDRIPMSALKDVIVTAFIRTVNLDYQQEPLATVNQYSVVDRITGRKE